VQFDHVAGGRHGDAGAAEQDDGAAEPLVGHHHVAAPGQNEDRLRPRVRVAYRLDGLVQIVDRDQPVGAAAETERREWR